MIVAIPLYAVSLFLHITPYFKETTYRGIANLSALTTMDKAFFMLAIIIVFKAIVNLYRLQADKPRKQYALAMLVNSFYKAFVLQIKLIVVFFAGLGFYSLVSNEALTFSQIFADGSLSDKFTLASQILIIIIYLHSFKYCKRSIN